MRRQPAGGPGDVDDLRSAGRLPLEVAAGLNPIAFAVESEPADISQVEELMREYGFIEDEVDTDELVLAND